MKTALVMMAILANMIIYIASGAMHHAELTSVTYGKIIVPRENLNIISH